MERIKIRQELFRLEIFGHGIEFSLLPKDLEDDDILYVQADQHGEDAELIIYRERYETDEELEFRKKRFEMSQSASKQRRLESYLKLKEEFEDK